VESTEAIRSDENVGIQHGMLKKSLHTTKTHSPQHPLFLHHLPLTDHSPHKEFS
jgi:hypothetical protein